VTVRQERRNLKTNLTGKGGLKLDGPRFRRTLPVASRAGDDNSGPSSALHKKRKRPKLRQESGRPSSSPALPRNCSIPP
jgi:hypothetical protein